MSNFIRLYRLVDLSTGKAYGHAMPMSACAKACIEARKFGYNTGIERVE